MHKLSQRLNWANFFARTNFTDAAEQFLASNREQCGLNNSSGCGVIYTERELEWAGEGFALDEACDVFWSGPHRYERSAPLDYQSSFPNFFRHQPAHSSQVNKLAYCLQHAKRAIWQLENDLSISSVLTNTLVADVRTKTFSLPLYYQLWNIFTHIEFNIFSEQFANFKS